MLAKCQAVCPDFDGTFNYLPMFKRASAKIVARNGEAEILSETIRGQLSCWDEVETFMTPAFLEENHKVRRGTWSCLAKEGGTVFCRNKCNDSGEVRVTAKLDQRGMDFSKTKPFNKRACIDE
ncbi:Oidioi.mRNA.OKI2018_I69.PAR.g9263.t1.cds [Oikopleura dioica]|uniref:Oidioi.mRNA.OKI2018_I69.PAR.g9263.t1.cds n=1 Tax=Oikopleura dioica TaxID=34765 RepID=A0ABN7RP91_OIKDI|nr:Oidioi.mRNA.OKI2018_I69.PAR.g9263.t1.cds [Oikopleura dioica]